MSDEVVINENQEQTVVVTPQEATEAVAPQQPQANNIANLGLLETHLQVSNLVKIAFTINYEVLKSVVEQAPDELKATPHFKVLEATFAYYNTLVQINSGAGNEG